MSKMGENQNTITVDDLLNSKSSKPKADEEKFADFVKSQQGKYISTEDDKFIVSRVIRGQRKIFGRFTNLEYAKEYETNLIINGWDDTFKSNVSPCGKFIRKNEGKFYIIREINGQRINFGSFNHLDAAIKKREELIDDNWGIDEDFQSEKSPYGKYISCLNDLYYIQKNLDNEIYNFGTFDSLEDAITARDILISNNWDDSKVPDNLYSWRFFIKYRGVYNAWVIHNLVGNDLISFGLFNTVEDAKKALNILIENDWNTSYVPLEYYHERSNIRSFKRSSGIYYSVVRGINGEAVDFGSFENKSEAIEFRNQLLLSNWVIENRDEEEKYDEYIYQIGDKIVVKKDDIIYGEFDRICDAVDFRLECIKSNWNNNH